MLELLVSVGIFAAISAVIVGTLYSILLIRSKQQGIETGSQAARVMLTTTTNAVISATQVALPSADTVRITARPCRTIRKNGTVLEQAIDASPTCSPPSTGFSVLSPEGVTISSFAVTKHGGSFRFTLSGTFEDSLGVHGFDYETSVTPRIYL